MKIQSTCTWRSYPAKPKKGAAAKIDAAAFTPDRFLVMGDVVYLHYPNGMGRSKLDPGTVFARMGVWSTARNWRTVKALDPRGSWQPPDGTGSHSPWQTGDPRGDSLARLSPQRRRGPAGLARAWVMRFAKGGDRPSRSSAGRGLISGSRDRRPQPPRFVPGWSRLFSGGLDQTGQHYRGFRRHT